MPTSIDREMDVEKPWCTPGLRLYQTMLEKDRRARLRNQQRLRRAEGGAGVGVVQIFHPRTIRSSSSGCRVESARVPESAFTDTPGGWRASRPLATLEISGVRRRGDAAAASRRFPV